jgi:hypothetical protein
MIRNVQLVGKLYRPSMKWTTQWYNSLPPRCAGVKIRRYLVVPRVKVLVATLAPNEILSDMAMQLV